MRDLNHHLPAIEDLISHRGTMLLLDRVLTFENDSTTAEYVPRTDAWYADEAGNMPAWIGIELMAQTIAAHVGLLKRREGVSPKQGALLGTRRYTSTRSAFASGETLLVDAKMIYRDDSGLAAYECRIAVGGDEIASAVLKVFEPGDFETFLQASRS
jgi:predicted hotdog family 3-hydroxylacyl-ACP dehydratase